MQGRIELIVGPMFGGKSTELLRRLERQDRAGRTVCAVRSAIDTRYGNAAFVTTHSGRRFPAVVADRLDQVETEATVIGIDEGQFYADLAPACERWAAAGKVVIVAMLDGDANRKPFPGSQLLELLALTESVTKLLAVCANCGADAAFTKLVPSEHLDAQHINVGGAEKYRAVCRACHAPSQN